MKGERPHGACRAERTGTARAAGFGGWGSPSATSDPSARDASPTSGSRFVACGSARGVARRGGTWAGREQRAPSEVMIPETAGVPHENRPG